MNGDVVSGLFSQVDDTTTWVSVQCLVWGPLCQCTLRDQWVFLMFYTLLVINMFVVVTAIAFDLG